MATTNTHAFNLDLNLLVEEAFERCGAELRTGYDLRTATRSLNLLTIEWANRGINLWTVETVQRFRAEVSGPVPLPTEIHKYTVNRSTFVHKDAREQFEVRVHKRLIDIFKADQRVIESLTNLNLPTGVDIQIKI